MWFSEHRTGRGLLLAEALHALGGHVGRLWDVRAVSTGGRGRFCCRRGGEVRERRLELNVGVRASRSL